MQNPLIALPPELVLRILAELDVSSLSTIRHCSKSWNTFVDVHEEVLFATIRDGRNRTFREALESVEGIGGGYWNCKNWRDLCTYAFISSRAYSDAFTVRSDDRIQSNVKSEHPKVYERFVNTGGTLTWRFKPDFEQNFVVVTAHQGGVKVFDLDSSEQLWEIPEVRGLAV